MAAKYSSFVLKSIWLNKNIQNNCRLDPLGVHPEAFTGFRWQFPTHSRYYHAAKDTQTREGDEGKQTFM